jgi:hypothetical protein
MNSLNSVNKDLDRLYKLLPMVYRQRDAVQGFPLQALLRVIDEKVVVVETDIAQLYENWFIETCQDWVVPYIADLIGYQIVHDAGEPDGATTREEQLRNKILVPRRDVANTIRDRRRKGTLALLEQLARDVAGWPARAVEFYTLLDLFQNINALHMERGRTVDLRNGDALDRLDGPFDEVAHNIDVRSIVSHRTPRRYNIPSVGLFGWRLKVYSVTKTRARLLNEIGSEFFTFSILGNDTQLYTRAQQKAETQRSTNELNFPTPIRRRQFERDIKQAQAQGKSESDYYGEDKSLFIWKGLPEQPEAPRQGRRSRRAQQPGNSQPPKVIWVPVPIDNIVAADLSDWQYRPSGDQVAVDPVLGRIAFAPNREPKGGVKVLYHYAFSDDMGGGEYNRPLLKPPRKYQLFRVSKQKGDIHNIAEALELWENWKGAHPDEPQVAVIEIADSGVYSESNLQVSLGEKEVLQIRAANRKRPVIRLEEERVDRTNALSLKGGSQITGISSSRFTLDGLLIFGQGIQVEGEFAELKIRHCTLVPGWDLEHDCEPKAAHEASLTLSNTDALVSIEHSILGAIVVDEDEVQEDPVRIRISDSILDATDNQRELLSTSDRRIAHAAVEILRSTCFGIADVHAIELAENSIFNGMVRVARTQTGCVRFCYVPDGSRTPRRYNCQPDLVKQAVDEDPDIQKDDKGSAKGREIDRVRPLFNSTRYGKPTYCQLADDCAVEIVRGADDESEMGVFHDLFQPQRAANLRARLDDFTPAGMEAGIIYAS